MAEAVWLARLRLAAGSGLLARPGRAPRQCILPCAWWLALRVAADRLLPLIGRVGEEQPRKPRQ